MNINVQWTWFPNFSTQNNLRQVDRLLNSIILLMWFSFSAEFTWILFLHSNLCTLSVWMSSIHFSSTFFVVTVSPEVKSLIIIFFILQVFLNWSLFTSLIVIFYHILHYYLGNFFRCWDQHLDSYGLDKSFPLKALFFSNFLVWVGDQKYIHIWYLLYNRQAFKDIYRNINFGNSLFFNFMSFESIF